MDGGNTHIILDADYKIVLAGVTKADMLDNASGLVTGTAGNNVVGDSENNALSKIVAGANGLKATIYNDTLTGGVGNDTLNGAEGSDTYVWKRGDGNDLIREVFTLTDVNKLRLEGVSIDDIRMTYKSVPTLQIQVINSNGTAETITFDQAQRIYGTTKADVSKGFAIRYLELDNTIIDLTKGINIRPLQNQGSVVYGMEGLAADDTLQGAGALNGFEGNDTYIVDLAASPQTTTISDISGFNKLMVRNSDGYNLTITDSTLNGDRLYKYTKTQTGVTTIKQIVIINFNAHSKQWGFSSGQDENVVVGSAAQDMLLDLVGNSTITSSAGSDTIQFVREANTADTITDFTVGQDKIDLSHASFNGLQYSNLALSTSGGNALVYLGDNQQIRVNGVSHTALISNQFKFATASGGTQGTNGNDTLNGTSAANQILGLDGNDVINGLAGNDTLNGGNGADTLNGGDNDDKLEGKDGNDSLDGGTGNDTVFGDNGNDVLGGDYDNDRLYGEAGADTLYGGDGADSLTGGVDNDYVFGEAGNDTAVGAEGYDWIDLGVGSDRMETAFQHVTAADTIQGGAGLDVFHITSSTVAVSLDTGTLAHLRGFETISVQNNVATLTLGDAYLNAAGFEGTSFTFNASTSTFAATVNAGGVTAKNLVLRSGSGHDSLTGGSGADSMVSGSGNDTLTGGSGNDTLDAGIGDDRLLGDNGNDLSYGRDGNDTLFGWYGQDTLWGGNGTDTLGGDYDNDLLYGEAGNDNLFGHDGNDTLNGGAGTDALTGGAGADRFVFTVASDSPLWTGDWIYDFAVGTDKLDVSAIKTGIDVIGNAAFSSMGAAQWRYYALNGNTVNHLDANGDGTVDFEVVMVGAVVISESDFVFN